MGLSRRRRHEACYIQKEAKEKKKLYAFPSKQAREREWVMIEKTLRLKRDKTEYGTNRYIRIE